MEEILEKKQNKKRFMKWLIVVAKTYSRGRSNVQLHHAKPQQVLLYNTTCL